MKSGRVFGVFLMAMTVLLLVGILGDKVSALSIRLTDSSTPANSVQRQLPPTPEPNSLLLIGSSLVGIGCLGLKRKKN